MISSHCDSTGKVSLSPLAGRLSVLVAIEPEVIFEKGFERKPGAFLFSFQVVVHFLPLFGFAQGSYAETYLSFCGINRNNLGFDLIAHLKETRRLVHPFGAQLGHMNQSLDSLFNTHKNAEVRDARNL